MSLIQPTRVAFDDPDLQGKRAALVAELRTFLPDDSVLEREEEVRPYECDGLSAYRQLPLLVVLPRTVAEVQRILRLCHERRVPVVARGAGTGLSGGALPLPDGLLLSLARFNRILELDPIGRTARVQPGVRNLAISETARPHGLYYAPDPSSQIACTIGGNVAENSGGVHCLKYGLTVHNVLSVTFVTLEGELIELGSAALDSAGYDLLALFVGSEGMLGVMVEARVKLLPIPERAQALLAAFDDVERAGRAVGDIIAAGIIPAGLEMMDGPAITPAIRPRRRRSCSANSTAPTRRSPSRSCRYAPCCSTAVRPKSAPRRTKPSGCASGRGAKRPFPPSVASHPTTTAWTAPSRAAPCPRCCGAPPSCPRNTDCAWPMSSMPATATCIR